MMRLGVDTGGTFTDFVWVDARGRCQIYKVLSTPDDPSEAIIRGIAQIHLAADAAVIHGSTVATNALLERRGARTALITTAGFGDVLAIGRQNRPDIYALVPQKTVPLVPEAWRFELRERITADGSEQVALDPAETSKLAAHIAGEGIESVAVCLLFSYLYPQHERQIAQALAAAADDDQPVHVSLSSVILPEFREYERMSTTVINAYVAPLMHHYLGRLTEKLGSQRHLAIMQSNGGIISAAGASEEAARTVLSGPAGGVVGARYVASQAGFVDLITFDMGGTSTDVALCPGRLPTTSKGEIAEMPMRLPIIDIHTVGAGGGSLASVDLGGALHVGPQSAGADPGPACYGRVPDDWRLDVQGQTITYRATTTDANLVLGRLDSQHFLGGTMLLEEDLAYHNLGLLAQQLGLESAAEAAWQVIQVANATMERAIRRISVERGYDPRRFTLVAFGGAGPLHACELAEQLQIPRVLVPTTPGVLSALGMLAAAPGKDYSLTVMRVLEQEDLLLPWLWQQFDALLKRAEADMANEGYGVNELVFERAVDMRYLGQAHELTIPMVEENLAGIFHAAHLRRFAYQRPEAELEIVTIRLHVTAQVTPFDLERFSSAASTSQGRPLGIKDVWFDGKPRKTDLYQRDDLLSGQVTKGPAVIFQYDTTTVVPPGWQAQVDAYGNLLAEHA